MIRHPVWTAAVLAVAFYLMVAGLQVAFLGAGPVELVVWAPVSIAYGAAMGLWFRRNPTVRSRVDADQLRQIRAGRRSARRGQPVDLGPDVAAVLARQADHEARTLRRLRPVVPFVGVVIALGGVVAASLGLWLWAVSIWIIAVAGAGLLWWVFRREIRLAESLAER